METIVSDNRRVIENARRKHLSLVSVSEVDRPALVEDDDLVEDVVRRLGRLVDGDTSDRVVHRQTRLDRLAERDGRCRVETSGRVVPALEGRVGERDLGDGDSLAPASIEGGSVRGKT